MDLFKTWLVETPIAHRGYQSKGAPENSIAAFRNAVIKGYAIKMEVQLISDGTLEINGKIRPVGGQNEAFFHCRWGFDDASDKSRINNWLVAWPGAFCLETLRKLPDWKMLDVDVD